MKRPPSLSVLCGVPHNTEFGAGWSKTTRETGAEYLSFKLDDPSFTAPVYAQGDKGNKGDKGEHKLIWTG